MTIPADTIDEGKKSRRYYDYVLKIKERAKVPQNRSFAWLSLTILTISFFIIAAIRPTLVTIAKLSKKIKDDEELNKKMDVKIKSILAAQQTYANNVDLLFLLGEALPERSEFPKFAYFLEQSASSAEISLKSLSFEKIDSQNTDPALTTNILGFTLALEGDYLKLKKFLENLEQSRRIVKVNSSVFAQQKKENSLVLSLLISGTVFYKENK